MEIGFFCNDFFHFNYFAVCRGILRDNFTFCFAYGEVNHLFFSFRSLAGEYYQRFFYPFYLMCLLS